MSIRFDASPLYTNPRLCGSSTKGLRQMMSRLFFTSSVPTVQSKAPLYNDYVWVPRLTFRFQVLCLKSE